MKGVFVGLACMFLLAGCPDPNPADGAIKCNHSGERACPKGYFCDGASDTCWKDGHRPSSSDMGATLDGGAKAQGATCSGDGDCQSGHCADGVCCDSACAGQCQACDVGAGICTTVSGAPHGSRPACPGTGACASTCNGTSTACSYPDATTLCGAQTCSGSPPAVMSGSACNGMGACVPTGGTISMKCTAPFGATAICNGTQCGFSCVSPYKQQGSSCVAVFTPENANTNGAAVDFFSIWGSAANDILVGGNDSTHSVGVIYWNGVIGGAWGPAPALPSGAFGILGIWGDNSNDVYAVSGLGKIYYSTGAGSFTEAQSTGIFDIYAAVWGSGNNENVWAVGGTTSMPAGAIVDRHGQGATWAGKETPGLAGNIQLAGVWGSGDTDIYAVSTDGRIVHSPGNGTWGTPQQLSHTTNQLNAIWGADATHIWAVGAAGTILFTTGNGMWAAQPSGTTKDLYGVWGSSGGDIYAVGDGGVIVHSIGDGTWQLQTSNTTSLLRAVWGTSATNVYAVGIGAIITHFH